MFTVYVGRCCGVLRVPSGWLMAARLVTARLVTARPFALGLALMWATLALPVHTGFAQAQPIPANDRDLDRIQAKIKSFETLAGQCLDADCFEMDCATAQQLYVRLRDARIAMRYAAYWLRRAGNTQMEHLKSVAAESTQAGERAAKVQKIVAWQQYVHDIASGLLEVASLSSNINDILADPKLLESKSYGEMAGLLDKFYEAMKDAESLNNRLKTARHDRDFPSPIADMMPALGGLSSAEMNDLKSTASDLKSLVEAAQKHGSDWRKVLREGKGAAAIGQIAGRYLKVYSASQIAERKRLVDNLLNDILAQDVVQSQSFRDLQRIQLRRNKAEDAYMALHKLVVIDAGGGGQMARCLMKLNRKCTSLDLNYASKYRMPTEVEVEDFNIITDKDKAKSWGKALLTINATLPTVEGWLQDVPRLQPAPAPSLRLAKTSLAPGEEFSASYVVSSCLEPTSWVAIVDSATAHGQESVNAQQAKSEKRNLKNATGGTITFKAPTEPGSYDVRMSDSDSGREVTSVSFKVSAATPTEPAPPLQAHNPMSWEGLSGPWAISYEDQKRGTVKGYVIIGERGKMVGKMFFPEGEKRFMNTSLKLEGGTLKGSYWPYFEAVNFELQISGDGNTLSGQWTERANTRETPSREGQREYDDPKKPDWYRARGRETWTRAVPQIESITVVPLQNWALNYPEMQKAWKAGNDLPRIALDVKGQNLPIYLYKWEETVAVQFDDPKLRYRAFEMRPKENTLRLEVRLEKDARPGRKSLTLNGVQANWNLEFKNYTGAMNELLRDLP